MRALACGDERKQFEVPMQGGEEPDKISWGG